jgi:hypothetical protein
MKHRFAAVLSLAMLVLTLPVAARVLSYAPYSNRTSMSGYHERTSRRFVVIESATDLNVSNVQQLVLYDTAGTQEPRVVYPPDGGLGTEIQAAALYERNSTTGPLPPPPLLLVMVYEADGAHTKFSPDGGTTWNEVFGTRNKFVEHGYESDFGGPYVQGLSNPIRTGSDERPFLVSYEQSGVYAITGAGELQPIVAEPYVRVIGQDRTGTHLLLARLHTIETIDLGVPGGFRQEIATTQNYDATSGWIADDGSAYVQVLHSTGRYLFVHRNEQNQFIRGPYGRTPPPLGISWPHDTVEENPLGFFAVPTADFGGAWLIQRQAGQPTTLSRYTPAKGVETMWSDVSGPEVEALIAGNSGQTLLVQVHRDRSVQMQRPFVDPALAVWRVGEPAPHHYDELYVNEESNKGFIHVDVDGMTAGESFAFNSGVMGEPIFSPDVGGGGDVVQEWGVVRASLRQQLVLPGVARLHGAFDSRWLTDVTLFNPLAAPQDVNVRFVALGESIVETASVREKTITLQPHEIRFIPDVLQALFSIGDGGGALHFIPAQSINVTGRTYSQKEGAGTFGFGMQAIDLFNTAGPRFPVTFAGAFPGSHFRTNVLLTDTSGRGTVAALNAFGLSGEISAGTKTINAPPGGILQFNGMESTLGIVANDVGGLVVRPTHGTAIATVVAIDNRTNDPTYFPPDLTSSNYVRAIPVIGHLDGANGSHFRSDLYVFNPTGDLCTVTLEAKQWDGPAMKLVSFTLQAREARVIPDALPSLFQLSGLARLRYWSNTAGDGARVTSRTYTVDADGATYGSLIPPLNHFQIAAPGDALEILGISGGTGFRTNLGLVELSPRAQGADANVRIRVLDERLTELDTFTVKVPRAGGMQLNDLFRARGIAAPEAAMVVVQMLDGGSIGAYATFVDNITNDATYLGAQLAAQEN